ncbi:MAG TPA: hypothetical protein VGO58_12120 [Chitinophagaceae bacterium]|nr:hypothetical protein [Chitinophagaceae bacterium]
MSKKIALPVILLFLCITTFAQNNIGLFEECNYAGRKYYLTPGSYKGYSMQIPNDRLSSMQIPNGMRITIYEHDDFKGKSVTYTSSVACLADGWNDNTSSMVVENLTYNNNNNNNNNYPNNNYPNNYYGNDYVTFYNDCYSKGYSQSLRPGTYYGNQLGILKTNISSFYITGNLRVKMYFNSDNASGYSTNFDESQSCLTGSYNDKVRSIVIEARPANYQPNYPNNNYNNGNNTYATVYADCNYGGNSLRLEPGNYEGNKLGLLRYNISAIELPSNLRAKVYINNEYLSGSSYTISESSSCLSSTLNNRIGSLVIEERYGYNNNNNNYNNNYGNNDQLVTLYTDNSYKGLSASLLPGSYATMEQAGFIDKNLSSLTVPVGYRVVVYEKQNFQGKSFTIMASRTSFSLTGWNDRASSIVVYRN